MGQREAQIAHPCTAHDRCGCVQADCCLNCLLEDCDPHNKEGITQEARTLRDTVPVGVLAKRFGIHQATLYRWLEEDGTQERAKLWDWLGQIMVRLDRLEKVMRLS